LRELWALAQQSHPTREGELIEPFGGSLSVALQLQPTHAVLSDLNSVLMGLYREVQSTPIAWDLTSVLVPHAPTGKLGRVWPDSALRRGLDVLPLSRGVVGQALYSAVRHEFNRMLQLWRTLCDPTTPRHPQGFSPQDIAPSIELSLPQMVSWEKRPGQDESVRLLWDTRISTDPTIQAFRRRLVQLFYYLLRTCFNGLCRFGPTGFNVPYCKKDSPMLVLDTGAAGSYSTYHEQFAHWRFQTGDYRNVFAQRDSTRATFLYADPPYDTPFTKYAADDFLPLHQVQLMQWLKNEALANPTTTIVVSNESTPFITELYAGQNTASLTALQTAKGIPTSEQMSLSLCEELFAKGYPRDRMTLLGLRAPRRVAANGGRERAFEVLLVLGLSQADVRTKFRALPADLQYAPQWWNGTGWSAI